MLSHFTSGITPTSSSMPSLLKKQKKKKQLCVARPNFILRPHFYSLLWFETDETPQDETKIHLSLQIVENSLRRFTEKLPYETFTFLHQSKHWLHRWISMLNFHLRLWIWRNLQFSTLMHWLCWTASTCLTLNCNFCFSPWDLIFPLNLLTCFRTVDDNF